MKKYLVVVHEEICLDHFHEFDTLASARAYANSEKDKFVAIYRQTEEIKPEESNR